MRPEDEKILDELVTDRDAGLNRPRLAAVEKRASATGGNPDYFTGDPEADAYLWFSKNTQNWRKPGSWDTIPRVNRMYIPDSLRPFIESLPVLNITSLWPEGKPEFPLEDFSQSVVFQWFLLQDGGVTYIVDGEGYQYLRYCCELGGNWL